MIVLIGIQINVLCIDARFSGDVSLCTSRKILHLIGIIHQSSC